MSSVNLEKMNKCIDTMLQNDMVNQDDANTLTFQDHEDNLGNKSENIIKIKENDQHAVNIDRFSRTDDGEIHGMIDESGAVDQVYDSDNSSCDATVPLLIKVKQTAKPNIIPEQILTSNPRGLVISITIAEYNDINDYRKSASFDRIHVKKLFKQLGFKVIERTNIDVQEFRELLNEKSKSSLLKKVDSVFVIISAHGGSSNDESVIYFRNGQMTHSELVNYFSDQNCPAMAGKPKLLFVQACRGEIKRYDDPLKGLDIRTLENPYVIVKGKPKPSFSNIYIVNSTLPNHSSYCNINNGSYFIQTLCDVFQNNACGYSVHDLMLLISEKMNKKRFGDKSTTQALAVKTIRVCKRLYLNPPKIKKPEWAIE